MNFREYPHATRVRLTENISVPLVQPLEIDESKASDYANAILGGKTSRISSDTAYLLFTLGSFRGGWVQGSVLWGDLYQKGVSYDAKDLSDEVIEINSHFRSQTIYPGKVKYNSSEREDIIGIEKTGKGFGYVMDNTFVYSRKTLEESYRMINSQAYAPIPLTPTEAGVVIAAVLDNRSGKLPFVGPYALPDSVSTWFKEAPIRSIGGISNEDLQHLRHEAYAKVLGHIDQPQLPFNDALLELQEYIASVEREITRPAVIQAIRPEERESFMPIYGRK